MGFDQEDFLPKMPANPLQDSFQRTVDYLRISVTDRCNLRCRYCMPSDVTFYHHSAICTYEELAKIGGAFVDMGIKKIRITGGEPLVRRDLEQFIGQLRRLSGDLEICLTTNGVLLADRLQALKGAGLNRINLSLDTFHPERFKDLTGFDGYREVMEAIDAIQTDGTIPLKVNCVVMGGRNDDELVDFARFAEDRAIEVRFIEFMPYGSEEWQLNAVVPTAAIQKTLGEHWDLSPIKYGPAQVARRWRLGEGPGVVGVISAVSEHFCDGCNKVRVDARGRIRTCLFGEDGVDLQRALRRGADQAGLQQLIREAIALKPESHEAFTADTTVVAQSMSKIGG